MYKYMIYCPNLMYNKLPSVVDYQILNCDHNALVPYCHCVIFATNDCHLLLQFSHTVI